MEPQYLEQYRRVKRWLSRLEVRNELPLVSNEDKDEYQDILLAFFQNCWHLKDWIRNDVGVPEGIRDSIEGDIKAYENIMICADMANATKHLVLDTQPRAGAARRIDCTVFLGTAFIGREPKKREETTSSHASSIIYNYLISVEGGTVTNKKGVYKPIDVARESVHEWEVYLKSKGLLT